MNTEEIQSQSSAPQIAEPQTAAQTAETLQTLLARSVVSGHIPGHTCKVCERVRNRILAGRPSKKAMKEAAEARRQAKKQAKQDADIAKKVVQAKQDGQVEGILAGQVAAGKTPDIVQAVKLTGASANKAKEMIAGDLVQAALLKNGITVELLDEVGLDGLRAEIQKIYTDQDGKITDVINFKDHHARHKFWRDYNLMFGRLGREEANGGTGGGGLIIITPDAAKVSTNHSPACICDDCKTAWEEKARHLRVAAIRERAITIESSPVIPAPAPQEFSPPDDEEENDFSDRPESHSSPARKPLEPQPIEYGDEEDDFS